MKNFERIKHQWLLDGIKDKTKWCFYCGTGWRASEILFYAICMGHTDACLYDGGWKEWSEELENK